MIYLAFTAHYYSMGLPIAFNSLSANNKWSRPMYSTRNRMNGTGAHLLDRELEFGTAPKSILLIFFFIYPGVPVPAPSVLSLRRCVCPANIGKLNIVTCDVVTIHTVIFSLTEFDSYLQSVSAMDVVSVGKSRFHSGREHLQTGVLNQWPMIGE